MHNNSPEIKYSREQLIVALAAEYEYFSNQEVLEDYPPVSEYIEQPNGLFDEYLFIATETDNNEFTPMSSWLLPIGSLSTL